MHAHDSSLLAILVLLPLIGAAVTGLAGKRYLSVKAIHTIACGTVGIAALLAWVLFFQLI